MTDEEELMKTITLPNEDVTKKLACDLATLSKAGDIFLLTGDLGAGKTTFTKGFAEGLGISQMIKSPTYTLIKEYETGRLPLYHMDVYRLAEGASDLGLEEYLEGDGVCIIEWGHLIKTELYTPYLEIFIDKSSDTERDLRIESSIENNPRFDSIILGLQEKGWVI